VGDAKGRGPKCRRVFKRVFSKPSRLGRDKNKGMREKKERAALWWGKLRQKEIWTPKRAGVFTTGSKTCRSIKKGDTLYHSGRGGRERKKREEPKKRTAAHSRVGEKNSSKGGREKRTSSMGRTEAA